MDFRRPRIRPELSVSSSFSSPYHSSAGQQRVPDPSLPASSPALHTEESHGITSGYQTTDDSQLEKSRKRKRLDNITMTGDFAYPPGPRNQHAYHDATGEERHDSHHAELFDSDTGFITSPVGSVSSQFSRRWSNLTDMLSPCCGFGWDQQTLPYQAISATPVEEYDPVSPYMAEKMPSTGMQPGLSASSHAGGGEARLVPGLEPSQVGRPALDPARSCGTQPVAAGPSEVKLEQQISLLDTQPCSSHSDLMCPSTTGDACAIKAETTGMIPATHMPSSANPYPMSGPFVSSLSSFAPGLPHGVESWLTGSHDGYGYAVALHTPQWATQGQDLDADTHTQRGGKRGPFKDSKLREQTAETRKIGSCIRCRMQRIRCENTAEGDKEDCMTCQKVSKTKMGRFPCLRYKMTDVKMYKPGQVPGYEWTRRWNHNISDPIQKWSSTDVKIIQVSEVFSKVNLRLHVRRFEPQEGDKIERSWYANGSKRSVVLPPYALVNLEEARQTYNEYIGDSMMTALPKFLGPKDGLIYLSYQQAWQLCTDPSTPRESLKLLKATFKLWMSIRCSTNSVFIVGNETLGMSADTFDKTSPYTGKIPIPPVLGAQLDVILIHHIQTKLRREVLDLLQKIYHKNKPTTWMLTYLISFMLLHNAALITAHDASYAAKHGMGRRFAREDKVVEYHTGANILLAHFHYCNRGMHPFSDECTDQDLRTRAGLSEDQIRFVHMTRRFARHHQAEWEKLQERKEYEKNFFFIGQLYEKNWEPRSMDL